MTRRNAVLRADALAVSFKDGDRTTEVLHSVSFELNSGLIYSVAGRSGSGKTTVLRLLLGLETPNAVDRKGNVWLADRRVQGPDEFARLRRDHVVYVSQSAELVSFLTVLENLRISEALGGLAVSMDACMMALERLGVVHVADRLPAQISGGERQRCAIARSLARATPFLVVDEPTSSLDDESAELVIEALSAVRTSGTAVLVTSHDQRLAALADVNYVLSAGTLLCS